MRQGVLSSHPFACTTFANVCAKSVKPTYMALKQSVAMTLSTNVDLATERLGVHVATIVGKMMKRKFATSGISNFGCAIPGLLAMLHRMVFGALSRSSGCSVLSSLLSLKNCETVRGGLEVFSRSHRSSQGAL